MPLRALLAKICPIISTIGSLRPRLSLICGIRQCVRWIGGLSFCNRRGENIDGGIRVQWRHTPYGTSGRRLDFPVYQLC